MVLPTARAERIRLADVDCPEYYESGYSEASDYLSSLIYGKTVYLDVDDVYTYDYSGTGDRLVCVAYVDYDSTHWINVNQALLDEGHAVISNFNNEFNPYLWSLYIYKEEAPESTDSLFPFPTTTPEPGLGLDDLLSIALVMIAVLLVFVVVGKISKRVSRE
jgi:hypothetical protein